MHITTDTVNGHTLTLDKSTRPGHAFLTVNDTEVDLDADAMRTLRQMLEVIENGGTVSDLFVGGPSKTFHADANAELVITDPCYLIDEWDEFCNLFLDTVSDGIWLRYKGCHMVISGTAYGDGSYRAEATLGAAGSFGVDAGLFCIVRADQLRAAGIKIPEPGLAATLHIGEGGWATFDGEGRCSGIIKVDTRDGGFNDSGDEEEDEVDEGLLLVDYVGEED